MAAERQLQVKVGVGLPRLTELGPGHWRAEILIDHIWHEAYGDSERTALMCLVMDLAERIQAVRRTLMGATEPANGRDDRAPVYEGRARYVPYQGAWSLFHLEFDPPMTIPAHHGARYSTPPLPDGVPDGPGPWFPVRATFEPEAAINGQ